jgi:hypothetical protein
MFKNKRHLVLVLLDYSREVALQKDEPYDKRYALLSLWKLANFHVEVVLELVLFGFPADALGSCYMRRKVEPHGGRYSLSTQSKLGLSS